VTLASGGVYTEIPEPSWGASRNPAGHQRNAANGGNFTYNSGTFAGKLVNSETHHQRRQFFADDGMITEA